MTVWTKKYDDQLDALTMTYEDWEDETGPPYGIARTNELYLYGFDSTPASSTLAALNQYIQSPPVLLPDSSTLSQTKVFGGGCSQVVTIDSSSSSEAQTIDKNLDFLFQYYQTQIAQRRWYGFWDHGDIMHTYDEDRNQWRYDIGGYAWDNSELSPDLWLWQYFLQTRRSDVFRVAEALTRHTGEVDVYHIGKYKGLGTRHGVQHWSDSCKQLRISNASYRRHFYHLSGADERIGDLLHECLHGEDTLTTLDPYRKVRKDKTTYRPNPEAVSVSLGTDWSALAVAWLVEVERRGPRAQEAKSKLMRSIQGIGALKNGFVTGMAVYNTRTGDVTPPGQDRGNKGHVQVSHLSAMFGLAEVCAELLEVYKDELPNGFETAWLEYCRYFNASGEEQLARFGVSFATLQLRQGHSRLTAYAASRLHDPNLARRAWEEFHTGDGYGPGLSWTSNVVDGSRVLIPIQEAPWISTNITSLYGLAAIQNLSLVGDTLAGWSLESNGKVERNHLGQQSGRAQ